MNKQLSIAVTLCAVTGGFSVAQAQVMCGDTITTSEVLTEDLLCGSNNPALTIQGPGGRLDMRRFTLSCEGNFANGIALTGDGAVLQNGFVIDCRDGLELFGSNHRVLNEMTVENNSSDGVFINSGSGHQVRETISRNNGSDGFFDSSGGGNTFERNQATGNDDDGFEADTDANGDTLTRNVATNNDDGFQIGGDNHLLSQNVAQGNEENGFEIEGSNNRLTRNTARNNFDDGVDVQEGALNNTLTDNRGSGNGTADVEGNGGFDLEDDNPDCDNNSWTKNRGTRNQPTCIR